MFKQEFPVCLHSVEDVQNSVFSLKNTSVSTAYLTLEINNVDYETTSNKKTICSTLKARRKMRKQLQVLQNT